MALKTPVLFIVFNRPDLTRRVFEQIQKVRPEKLYIAFDHPRNDRDLEACKQVRSVFRKIDWNCELHFKTNPQNLGCKEGVKSAIDWFFESEPMGIILEDDCLPDETFFTFCQTMLYRYENDSTVGHISGSNFLDFKGTQESYYFSTYNLNWGWATWARVWKHYDIDTYGYQNFDYSSLSSNVFEQLYWFEKLKGCAEGKINTWDYQYTFMLWKHKLKSINPTQNLISNIGFDTRATHWNVKNFNLSNLPLQPMNEINHPSSEAVNHTINAQLFNRIYNRIFVSNLIHLFLYCMGNLQLPVRIGPKLQTPEIK